METTSPDTALCVEGPPKAQEDVVSRLANLLCHLALSLQSIRNLSGDQWAELNNLIRLKTRHMTRYGTVPVLLHA